MTFDSQNEIADAELQQVAGGNTAVAAIDQMAIKRDAATALALPGVEDRRAAHGAHGKR